MDEREWKMKHFQLCQIQVERPIIKHQSCFDEWKKRYPNKTKQQISRLLNLEVDFYDCGCRAKYKVTHHINIRANEMVQYCCGVHTNQLKKMSKRCGLPIIIEPIK